MNRAEAIMAVCRLADRESLAAYHRGDEEEAGRMRELANQAWKDAGEDDTTWRSMMAWLSDECPPSSAVVQVGSDVGARVPPVPRTAADIGL